MPTVLMPLPAEGFDPTESAVPWQQLSQQGFKVVIATPDGQVAQADPRMLHGVDLGLLKPVLQADANGRAAYAAMAQSPAFLQPLRWVDLRAEDFDGMLLPGGHAPGMKTYLESAVLQARVAEFFASDKPVGAICHGVVLAARAQRADGQSVLHGRKTTALTQQMELTAWSLTRAWLGDYYRTYPETVQAEVTRALSRRTDFELGPVSLRRDSPEHLERGFTVRDGNYLSARWPGDAHRFAHEFAAMLQAAAAKT